MTTKITWLDDKYWACCPCEQDKDWIKVAIRQYTGGGDPYVHWDISQTPALFFNAKPLSSVQTHFISIPKDNNIPGYNGNYLLLDNKPSVALGTLAPKNSLSGHANYKWRVHEIFGASNGVELRDHVAQILFIETSLDSGEFLQLQVSLIDNANSLESSPVDANGQGTLFQNPLEVDEIGPSNTVIVNGGDIYHYLPKAMIESAQYGYHQPLNTQQIKLTITYKADTPLMSTNGGSMAGKSVEFTGVTSNGTGYNFEFDPNNYEIDGLAINNFQITRHPTAPVWFISDPIALGLPDRRTYPGLINFVASSESHSYLGNLTSPVTTGMYPTADGEWPIVTGTWSGGASTTFSLTSDLATIRVDLA